MPQPQPEARIFIPILLSACFMCLRLLVRWALDAESLKRSNSGRGHQLFRVCFLAPDLIVLSIGLLIASEGLRAILKGRQLETLFCPHFPDYFWGLIVLFFVFLLACIVIWNSHDDDERAFVSHTRSEIRLRRTGETYDQTVWEVDWRASFGTRPGILVIGFCNFLGSLSVLSYAFFIYLCFVTP
jgi:hypothetical protein